jgi:hypothetical protein
LKHGRAYEDVDDMTLDENGTLVPQDLSHEDSVGIYQVESLAHSFNAAAASYRRVAKGAVLRVQPDGTYAPEADEELEKLMESIDRRMSLYGEILSPFGSTATVSPADPDSRDAYDELVAAQLNVRQEPWQGDVLKLFGLSGEMADGPPNYEIRAMGLGDVEAVTRVFDEQVQQLTGLTSEELIAFLWAMSWRQYTLMLAKQQVAFQFIQRAYMLTTEGDAFERTAADVAPFVARWLDSRGKSTTEVESIDIVHRGFRALQYTEDELRQIDLWSKTPYKPIVRDGDFTLWDFSAIPYALGSVFTQIGLLTGAVGNAKGANFEDELVADIDARDDLDLWEVRRGLKAVDGDSREIDVSFLHGDVLYVVECKALSAHPDVDRGAREVLARRWEKLTEYLRQVDSLRAFLLAHPEGRNYSLPAGVETIRACICTPMPEYIPTRDPAFWLTDECPRVCVPAELLALASQEDPVASVA